LDVPKTALGEEVASKCPHCSDPYHIYCHYKDKKGNIWFGTAVLGAFRYNGKSFDWISEPDVTEIHDGPSNGIRSITEDSLGRFWFNTDYYYEVYDGIEAGRLTFYDKKRSIGSLDGWKGGDLTEYLSIITDNDYNLWIATYSKGVWKYNGNKIQHIPVQVQGKDIHLFCLYKDNQGKIWLGTHEQGVWILDGGMFRKFEG
jgi:ligand-binding sensor domain-containing protein